MSKDIYRYANKSLKKLFRLLESRMQRMVSVASWDELNVLAAVNEIYNEVEEEAERQYLDIAQRAYKEASREIIAVFPEKKDKFKPLTAMFIAGLLDSYDTKTEYVYRHEVDRKKARLAESLIAINRDPVAFNSNATREALKRAIGLMERQMRNMADTVTDEARRQADADAGVGEVMWHIQDSEACAKICKPRDQHIYPLYGVPAKHPNCRCYLTPVTREE